MKKDSQTALSKGYNDEIEDTGDYALSFESPRSVQWRRERRVPPPPSEEYLKMIEFLRTHDVDIDVDFEKGELIIESINLSTGEVESREIRKMPED